ncbi:hypothetical protein HHK36_020726 [Tetracentron sinense]|uniref:Pentatricopeptide repeat-containing protein n=1 Tax=Tetracentron sinense TaxID=13715 RepID=A0A835D938_TETSI|nr:hypothetical protein HHK36_020726 [Tetracentron sinense]
MIGGYLRNERYPEALEMYEAMRSHSLRTDSCTCTFELKACTSLSDFETGMEIIDEARRLFDEMPPKDVVCWNSMIGGYVGACDFDKAFDLFFKMWGCGIRPSPITMASLIQACGGIGNLELGKCIHGCVNGLGMGCDILFNTSLVDMYGYVQNGLYFELFDLFFRLVSSGGGFDSVTMVSLLQGCAQIACLFTGKVLHGCVLRRGLESNLIVLTAIVDLYVKCGSLKLATSVFSRMQERNVISWTAMLVGLAQNGHAEDALRLFRQMQEEGVALNSVTLVSLIHACAQLGSLKKGKSVQAHLIRCGFVFNAVNITSLVDMYAKCGKVESAKRVFDNGSTSKDIVLWNSMITGYGIHGYGRQAVGLYDRMIKEGLKPNQTTFISLLSACSHSGRLEEAKALIKQMPFEPGNAVLEALLSGCRTHKNINMGICTADRLLSLDVMNPGIYIVLSNIYAEGRRWNEVDYVRGLMRKRGLRKTPGYSLIEVGNQVHAFFAGDNSHPFWSLLSCGDYW